MKVFELILLNRPLLNICLDTGIRANDVRFIDLYKEYDSLYKEGNKVSYIVAYLSEKYGISERKVYDLLRRFKEDCNIGAV